MKLIRYEWTDLADLGPLVSTWIGEENWYFIVIRTGERGYIKCPQ